LAASFSLATLVEPAAFGRTRANVGKAGGYCGPDIQVTEPDNELFAEQRHVLHFLSGALRDCRVARPATVPVRQSARVGRQGEANCRQFST
jgi:hypothetical protein